MKLYGLVLAFIAMVGVMATFVSGGTAYADWGCPESAGIDDRCVAENYDNIVPSERGVSPDQYKKMIQDCKSGNSDGFDWGGATYGECANAAALCLQRAIDTSGCTANNLATLAVHCNDGKNTSNGCDNDKIRELNDNYIKKIKDDASNKAEQTCNLQGNAQAQFDQKQACKDAVINACQDQNPLKTNGTVSSQKKYNEYGASEYQTCLNNAMRNSAKNADECTARGGQPQTDDKGAYTGCGTPPPAQQNGTCKDGSKPDATSGKCTDGSSPTQHVNNPGNGEQFQNCGEAETVLVSCTAQNCGLGANTIFSGTPVIGCVLKFGIQALTVLVGVGAVAGIAWESLQYARAQDNQSAVANARDRIRDIVIGLVVYIFMIAILQWLIPGMVIG